MAKSNIKLSYFSEYELEELHSFITLTVEHSYKGLYVQEAIDFFLDYLDKADILRESRDHPILVLREDGRIVGTATLIERHVKRVFVEPSCQSKGYGRLLMEKLENIAVENGYSFVELHSSLFAKYFYDKLRYLTFKIGTIPVKNGQVLTYYRMAKFLKENRTNSEFGINENYFVIDTSSVDVPLFSFDTKFIFYQQENLIYIEYSNKYIKDGEMFGAFEGNNQLLFYNHTDNGISERGIFIFEFMRKKIRLSLLGHTQSENSLRMNGIIVLKPVL